LGSLSPAFRLRAPCRRQTCKPGYCRFETGGITGDSLPTLDSIEESRQTKEHSFGSRLERLICMSSVTALKSRLTAFQPKPRILMLLAVLVISARFIFMLTPSLWLAGALWLVAGLTVLGWAGVLHRRAVPLHGAFLVGLGASANGLVMVANNGVMPVLGMAEELNSGGWRSADEGGYLLFLADRMSLGGASPGDILIATGILFTLAVVSFRGLRRISLRLRAASP
jgi:hypothetical protein